MISWDPPDVRPFQGTNSNADTGAKGDVWVISPRKMDKSVTIIVWSCLICFFSIPPLWEIYLIWWWDSVVYVCVLQLRAPTRHNHLILPMRLLRHTTSPVPFLHLNWLSYFSEWAQPPTSSSFPSFLRGIQPIWSPWKDQYLWAAWPQQTSHGGTPK